MKYTLLLLLLLLLLLSPPLLPWRRCQYFH
jgi:hypothetical protein